MTRRVWGRPYRARPRDRTLKYTMHAYIRLEVGHNHTEPHTEYLINSASTERDGQYRGEIDCRVGGWLRGLEIAWKQYRQYTDGQFRET
jgi:hypothetical protein